MTAVANQVPAFEHGRLRLFTVDREAETGRRLIEAMDDEPRDAGAALDALGAERIDPYWLDLVARKDIASMGLPSYLRQGYDIPAEEIEAAHLPDAWTHILVVPSRAFKDTEQALHPDDALRPIAMFDVAGDPGPVRPMEPAQVAPVDRDDTGSREPERKTRRGLHPSAILLLLLIAAAFILIVAR